jgi:hypothetical protein
MCDTFAANASSLTATSAIARRTDVAARAKSYARSARDALVHAILQRTRVKSSRFAPTATAAIATRWPSKRVGPVVSPYDSVVARVGALLPLKGLLVNRFDPRLTRSTSIAKGARTLVVRKRPPVRRVTASVALKGASVKRVTASVALKGASVKRVTASVALKGASVKRVTACVNVKG